LKVYIHEQLRRQKLVTNSLKASQKLFTNRFKARNYSRTASKADIIHEQLQSQTLFTNSFKARRYSRTASKPDIIHEQLQSQTLFTKLQRKKLCYLRRS
jgi:hypothetical protein